MASNVLVLPQALCKVPRNARQCASNKLGCFSAACSRRPPSISLRVSLSSSSGISFGKLNNNGSFLLRAEATSDESMELEAEEKPPGIPRIKFGDMMGMLNKRSIQEFDEVRPTPDVRTGDVVEIKMEFPEKWRYTHPTAQKNKTDGKVGKKEYKIYKGIVISRQNAGIHTTIRIRRIVAGVGVEIVFPLYSPNIKEIKVVHHRKVRRARLYYLRDKLPRFSTFK